MLNRRDLITGTVASGAILAASKALATPARRHAVVVGAGVFGSFTALALRSRGWRVTLVDPWGPGNARASSGGETRVIRGVYGADRTYTTLAAEAFERWRAFERRAGRQLLHPTGAIWLVVSEDDAFLKQAVPPVREAGLSARELSTAEASRKWPQIDSTGVRWVLHEEHAGFLLARRACAAAVETLVADGGDYVNAAAEPPTVTGKPLQSLRLQDGRALSADAYVFACGPWLPRLFPDLLGQRISPTRQDVLFFGPPRDDHRFDEGNLPIWIELGERLFYGIPGNESRGFKVADDTRGEPFDPTTGERLPRAESISRARDVLRRRFPALAEAPLVETRVCQYENTPDHDFILDRHPQAPNVWFVGGGSGHGFKFGPAWGERAAATIAGERPVERKFSLARFSS